jgi:hypothetical protein
MKVAKASKDDIQTMRDFFAVWEELERGNYQITKQEVKEYWQEDDRMFKLLMPYAVDEINDWDDVEGDTQVKFLNDWFGKVSWRKDRVIFGCEIMIDNACDPDKDYLAFKPEFANIPLDRVYQRLKGYVDCQNDKSYLDIIEEVEMGKGAWEELKEIYPMDFMTKEDIETIDFFYNNIRVYKPKQ